MYSDELYQPEKRKNDDKLFAIAKRDLKHPDGSELTDEQISQVLSFMRKMADITVEQYLKEINWKKKLEKSPNGYHFYEEGYCCVICGGRAYGEESWYDTYGLKCMTCQDAINKKIVPAFIAKNKDSYYTDVGLEVSFNMKRNVLNAFVKNGILKERVIPYKNGKGKHLRLFLLKDNKDFLPPHKKLEVGEIVKETNAKGEEEYVSYPWYYFVNPIEHLAKYGISKYMRWEKEASNKNKDE